MDHLTSSLSNRTFLFLSDPLSSAEIIVDLDMDK